MVWLVLPVPIATAAPGRCPRLSRAAQHGANPFGKQLAKGALRIREKLWFGAV